MSTQIERSRATRAKILAIARAAFVRDGYEASSLEAIAAEAGLTKGALYHHYAGKEALFAAVFRAVTEELGLAVHARLSSIADPRERLKAAALAWLDAVHQDGADRIVIDIAPEALGFARARAIEDEVTHAPLLALVTAVVEAERLTDSIDPLLVARLLSAALAEIVLLRRETEGRGPAAAMAERSIDRLIDGLLR